MIIRESPKAKPSPDKNSANWPPKSPYEALLSSPSGRKKWQERNDLRRQRTPSPSPRKGLSRLGDPFEFDERNENNNEDDDEDEDEETLRLKLQAIEAKLKLKKLQAKSKQPTSNSKPLTTSSQGAARPTSPPRKRLRLDDNIQVPVSPVRIRTEPVEPISPARVLLGIDKGWKAEDVSLKRPRPAGQNTPGHIFQKTPPRVKSFTERLAESRTAEVEQQQKAERIQNARGHSFSLQTASAASSTPRVPLGKPATFQTPSLLAEARLKRGTSDAGRLTPSQPPPALGQLKSSTTDRPAPSSQAKPKTKTALKREEDAAALEPFSNVHLSKRTISHEQLAEAFMGKELYPFPRLLKEVKSPDYNPPDCEADYVVFGVVTSKSQPFDVKSGPRTDEDKSMSKDRKFMVVHLTDFQWEVDLFLFGQAFGKYWKTSVGTVVAILNPDIMPPRKHLRDTGRFSLKLWTGDDQIIEIGQARDLGFCNSLKKDGKQCNDWIDLRESEHCTFHVNLEYQKTAAGRMEVNTLFSGQRRQRSGSGSPPRRGLYKNSRRSDQLDKKAEAGQRALRDYESGERFYMGPAGSSAKLLDAADELAAPERMRLHLKEREKDKVLADKLARLGNGAGAAYLRARSPERFLEPGEEERAPEVEVDAHSLGLMGRADQVRLSPVKGRKRVLDGGAGIGWAGAGKRGLLQGKRLGGGRAASPVKASRREESPKKARFVLNHGIKVPGRDSMGVADDSDDDLDVV